MNSSKPSTLALALKGFFVDYLPCQRALSPHTIHSYRDGLKLLLQFAASRKGDPSRLAVEQLGVEKVVDLSSIAHELGHASVDTTNKYISVDLEAKRETLAKAKPLLKGQCC